MQPLTVKQKLFVEYYLVDRNATQAAIKAGYKSKAAASMGAENLRKPQIAEHIEKRMSEVAKKIGITQEKVLEALWSIAQRCLQAEPVLDREGNPTGEYKFDASGANKSLELVGRHLKMFTDRIEGQVKLTHEDALNALK